MSLPRYASIAAIALLAVVSAPMLRDPHRPVDAYPDTIGNSDTASYATRYAANRAELTRLSRAGGPRAALYARWVAQRPQILAFDPRGDGRLVEVLGDLAHADRVVVYVPGNAKRLENFDEGTAARPRTAPGPVARDLLAAARRARPTARTAVIAWLGYDGPENIDLVAAESVRAQAGARSLTRLLRILPRRARVSLVCHSYGTVVCGRVAARTRVANVVALASPGLDARSARTMKATVWAGRATDDPIRFTPHVRLSGIGHGPDPMSPSFGAHRIDTTGAHGHEAYFTPGGRSLRQIAEIVTGDGGAGTV